MKRLHSLSKRYGFRLIEDASHAIGGSYLGEPIGNCRYSDVCIFSFHPVKIITTAEGGMALTNDAELARRMALLRTHGITRDPAQLSKSDGPWYYEQIDLGYNYRMTDMQAALGASQMARIDQFIDRRHELASRYDRLLADLPLTLPWQHPDGRSGLHLYVVRLQLDRTNRTHREVFDELRARGILVNLHYIPIYRQPYYARFRHDPADFPESEAYYREAISIPIFHGMSNAQQDQVVEALRDIVG
jgi:dTDP-4-amino-4,6-dideoxygalactose transaminase